MSQNPIPTLSSFFTPGGKLSFKRGALGSAANQTGVTTSAALATTYVGICLSNPAGSKVNLSLLRAKAQFNVAPAALTSVGLISGWVAGGITVHTTPLTVTNPFLNSAVALSGLVDSACTLVGTPEWLDWLGEPTLATSGGGFMQDYSASPIVIPPGGYVAIGTLIAGPAAGFLGSLLWEETAS
jgi:hypothetical protein